MSGLDKLLANNREWSQRIREADPDFFPALSRQQAPAYLWIGCSDSRVPANEVVGLLPGELFVHRNVANVVVPTDMNCMAVLQFAVEVLRVRHIIVCGHYGCGGVRAALGSEPLGAIDNWLRHIRDVRHAHQGVLSGLAEGEARADRLCELNVAAQVRNVAHTTTVQAAWARGQALSVHGLMYALDDGLLSDLDVCIDGRADLDPVYRMDTAAK